MKDLVYYAGCLEGITTFSIITVLIYIVSTLHIGVNLKTEQRRYHSYGYLWQFHSF